jgi:hypothetical protein
LNDIVNSIAETIGYPDETRITMDLQEALNPPIFTRHKVGKTKIYTFSKNHKAVSRSYK